MLAICLREFKSLFKSVRSIIIIFFIFGVTLGVAKIISKYQIQLESLGIGNDAYSGGLFIILFIGGPLFVTSLSHNVINRELYSRTIRFLATKTSRENIVLGKFLGTILFWSVCTFISLLLIIPFSNHFYFSEFIQSIIFISYFVGFTILLSTLIDKPALTMFLGITLSFIFPVLGVWSLNSHKLIITLFSYITPYFYYGEEQSFYPYFVTIFTLIFLSLSLFFIRKKDF